MVIGSLAFDWFLPAWPEGDDITRPVWANIARFDQYVTSPIHRLVGPEHPESIEVVRITANRKPSRHPKAGRPVGGFQRDRFNTEAGEPWFGARIQLKEDVDRCSKPVIDDQKVLQRIWGNWWLLVRRGSPARQDEVRGTTVRHRLDADTGRSLSVGCLVGRTTSPRWERTVFVANWTLVTVARYMILAVTPVSDDIP
jgi:hypothetical protein